jgi:prevent-host-death family protein
MTAWTEAEAKARFDELLDRAASEGPQLVRRGNRVFLVMTREAYKAGLAAIAKVGEPNARR